MILIDKANDSHKIIFTTNLFYSDDSELTLKFISDSTNKEFTFSLIGNLSSSNDRYIYFCLPNSLFTNVPSGYYNYSIKDVEGYVFSMGKAYVKDVFKSDFISAESDKNDEEFIEYNGE